MNKNLVLALSILALGSLVPTWADDDDTPGLDVPGQEQKLNAELWRFAKNSSYEVVQADLQQKHKESQKNLPAEVILPTGWRMAPAGHQLELGRYPMVAVPFGGNLVVLNNGYYWLPNDHTAGMDPKSLNPNQLVA